MRMKQWGLFLALIGALMCQIYRLTIGHIEAFLRIDDKIADYELISIEDYTVDAKIPPGFYHTVLKSLERDGQPSDEVPIKRFERFFLQNLKAQLMEAH